MSRGLAINNFIANMIRFIVYVVTLRHCSPAGVCIIMKCGIFSAQIFYCMLANLLLRVESCNDDLMHKCFIGY